MPALMLKWSNESLDLGPDPILGAPIRQLTSSPLISWGIYCEQIYASNDGRRIAFMRSDRATPPHREIWIGDLESGEIACVGPVAQDLIASTPLMDSIYYVRPDRNSSGVLVRLDLRALTADDVFAFADCPFPLTPAVSTDERWFVSNKRLHDNVYGLYRVDLRASRWDFFHEEKDICNTHAQFEPVEGRDILIQQNCGCVLRPDGSAEKLCGEQGGKLYVIDCDGKNQRFLPLGHPLTGLVDGHQCWIGRTKKVLAVVDDDLATGAQCVVTPGDREARHIMPGFGFIHVSASADGRFLAADHRGEQCIYLGSLETERVVRFCECPRTRSGRHETWEEPYIVPGNRHVVFNSERTGTAQVYVATVPGHVISGLTAGPA